MKLYRYGIVGLLIGLLLVFVSLYLDALLAEKQAADALGTHAAGLAKILVKLLETLGVTIFGVGLLNIMLETKDWRHYFGGRMRELVVDQSYLKTLDKDVLSSLQGNVLKALFKDQNIDREGSFLNYFHSRLHRYIADPYLEDVTSELICAPSGANAWTVLDRVTYVCRKSASGIQQNVRWVADPNEFLAVEALSVSVQYPYTHEKQGQCVILHDGKPSGREVTVELDNFKDVDGLIVITTSKYRIDVERFQYWTMMHPTRNFDITIIYPADHAIQTNPLILNKDLILITEAAGYFKAKYDSWMLPASGLAWRIVPARVPLAGVDTVSESLPDTDRSV
jgi:hypothetical protein